MGNEQPIILYASSECFRCQLVKQLLDAHNVKYIEKEIRSVPAIEIDGKIIDDYVNVLGWLEQNGYYSFEVNNNDDSD